MGKQWLQRMRSKLDRSRDIAEYSDPQISEKLREASNSIRDSTVWRWLLTKIISYWGEASGNIQIKTIYCIALGSLVNNRDSIYQFGLVKCLAKDFNCDDIWVVEPNLLPVDEAFLHSENINVIKPPVVPETLKATNGVSIESLASDSVSYLSDRLTESSLNRVNSAADSTASGNVFIFAPHCPMLITLGLGLLALRTRNNILLYVNDIDLYSRLTTSGSNGNEKAVRVLSNQLSDKLVSFEPPLDDKDSKFYSAFQSLCLYHVHEADS